MHSADPRIQVIPSFRYRAGLRLAELSRMLVALQLTEPWDSPYAVSVLRDAQYLRHGLRTLAKPGTLTFDQQRFICERLLPMIAEDSGEGSFIPPMPEAPIETVPVGQQPLSLVLDKLSPKVRGVASMPLTISGMLSGVVPKGAQLVILRNGSPFQTVEATAGRFSYIDTTPGTSYTVYVTSTALRRQLIRELRSPVLSGVLAHGATAAQLLTLSAYYPGVVNNVGRYDFVANRKRIYLAVPASLGTVQKLTQPNDNDADTTAAFDKTALVLDFGADGTDTYAVFENFADFIGSFSLDMHLVPNSSTSSADGGTNISVPSTPSDADVRAEFIAQV